MIETAESIETCHECQGLVPKVEGPTHEYIRSSPGCWKLFGDLLAKEYADPHYFSAHQLTVDTYAAQHPRGEDPRAIQSVNVHLTGLCLALTRGIELGQIPKLLDRLLSITKNNFKPLDPPNFKNTLHVIDVLKATNPKEHKEYVGFWAKSVWDSWHNSHPVIQQHVSLLFEN